MACNAPIIGPHHHQHPTALISTKQKPLLNNNSRQFFNHALFRHRHSASNQLAPLRFQSSANKIIEQHNTSADFNFQIFQINSAKPSACNYAKAACQRTNRSTTHWLATQQPQRLRVFHRLDFKSAIPWLFKQLNSLRFFYQRAPHAAKRTPSSTTKWIQIQVPNTALTTSQHTQLRPHHRTVKIYIEHCSQAVAASIKCRYAALILVSKSFRAVKHTTYANQRPTNGSKRPKCSLRLTSRATN